jgi:hypothetical protein
LEITVQDKKKLIELGFEDERINACTSFEDILSNATNPELQEKVKDCFLHRFFSH